MTLIVSSTYLGQLLLLLWPHVIIIESIFFFFWPAEIEPYKSCIENFFRIFTAAYLLLRGNPTQAHLIPGLMRSTIQFDFQGRIIFSAAPIIWHEGSLLAVIVFFPLLVIVFKRNQNKKLRIFLCYRDCK